MNMVDKVKRLAEEYAHCYSFVGDETMPLKRAELYDAIDELGKEIIKQTNVQQVTVDKVMLIADKYAAKFRSAQNNIDNMKWLNIRTELFDAVAELSKIGRVFSTEISVKDMYTEDDIKRLIRETLCEMTKGEK